MTVFVGHFNKVLIGFLIWGPQRFSYGFRTVFDGFRAVFVAIGVCHGFRRFPYGFRWFAIDTRTLYLFSRVCDWHLYPYWFVCLRDNRYLDQSIKTNQGYHPARKKFHSLDALTTLIVEREWSRCNLAYVLRRLPLRLVISWIIAQVRGTTGMKKSFAWCIACGQLKKELKTRKQRDVSTVDLNI